MANETSQLAFDVALARPEFSIDVAHDLALDGITALSGDTTGLEFRRVDPAIHMSIDVMTRLGVPSTHYLASFLEDLKSVLESFTTNSQHKSLVK